jgi:hypothetical protein
LIANDYILNVKQVYDGCTCCANLPEISVPCTIIPLTHQASYGFTEDMLPPGYAPQVLGYFRLPQINILEAADVPNLKSSKVNAFGLAVGEPMQPTGPKMGLGPAF